MAAVTPDPSLVQVLCLTESDLRGDDWAGTIEALVAAGTPRVVANVSEAELQRSLPFARLVWGIKRLRQAGGDLRLFDVPHRARRLLDAFESEGVFRCYATEAEAVASFDA